MLEQNLGVGEEALAAEPVFPTDMARLGSKAGAERRADARVPIQAQVAVRYGSRSYPGWLRDISAGGALVVRGAAPRPPKLHRLEIPTGRPEPLRLLVRVVRSFGTYHAVRFVGLDAHDRLELAEAVDQLRVAA